MNPRDEHVTRTGWRIVGAARSLVAAEAGASPLEAVRDDDTLFIVRFIARPWLGTASAVDEVLAVLSGAVATAWPEAPRLTRSTPVIRPGGRFDGVRWVTSGDASAWKGELFWRHPHLFIPGVPLTTHVVIEEQNRHTTIGVRVAADDGLSSVRGRVGAGQARPSFLTTLNRSLRLQFDGMDSAPVPLAQRDEVASFVGDVLLSETREHPVAVLTPLEDDSFETEAQELANELLGLAKLYVITNHRSTFTLSDTLGDRRLSAYWGAIRVYLPDFSCADPPQAHPLLVRDRASDPVMRAELVGKLAHFAMMRVRMPLGIAADTPVRRATDPGEIGPVRRRAPSAPAGVVGPAGDGAVNEGSQPIVHAAGAAGNDAVRSDMSDVLAIQVSRLADTIAALGETVSVLSDEMTKLRTSSAVRASNTNSLERRLSGIAALLERYFAEQRPEPTDAGEQQADQPDGSADRADPEQQTLTDVVRQAGASHSDALFILENAERSASASPYVDVERAAVILDAMADVARRRQHGTLQSSLRDAFRELGIEYRGGVAPSTSERLRRQYQMLDPQGGIFECYEHLAVGSSYDPRHCLRIYFTSRAASEARFVIGHVGRHFEVESTS